MRVIDLVNIVSVKRGVLTMPCAVQIAADVSASAQISAKVPAVNLLNLVLQEPGANSSIQALQQVQALPTPHLRRLFADEELSMQRPLVHDWTLSAIDARVCRANSSRLCRA